MNDLSLTLTFHGFPMELWSEQEVLLGLIREKVEEVWVDADGCEVFAAFTKDHRGTSNGLCEAMWIEGTYALERYQPIPKTVLDQTAEIIHSLLTDVIKTKVNTSERLAIRQGACCSAVAPPPCRFAKAQIVQLGTPGYYGLKQGPIAA